MSRAIFILIAIIIVIICAFLVRGIMVQQYYIVPKQEEKILKEVILEKEIFEPEKLNWEQAISSAPWPKRDAHTLNVFKNKLWIFGGVGGTSPDYSKNYSDVWNSENGKDWILVANNAPWGPRRAHD